MTVWKEKKIQDNVEKTNCPAKFEQKFCVWLQKNKLATVKLWLLNSRDLNGLVSKNCSAAFTFVFVYGKRDLCSRPGKTNFKKPWKKSKYYLKQYLYLFLYKWNVLELLLVFTTVLTNSY